MNTDLNADFHLIIFSKMYLVKVYLTLLVTWLTSNNSLCIWTICVFLLVYV